MSKVTYKDAGLDVRVYLDGKHVGTIKRRGDGPSTWQYFPKGSKVGGVADHSLRVIQRSLES